MHRIETMGHHDLSVFTRESNHSRAFLGAEFGPSTACLLAVLGSEFHDPWVPAEPVHFSLFRDVSSLDTSTVAEKGASVVRRQPKSHTFLVQPLKPQSPSTQKPSSKPQLSCPKKLCSKPQLSCPKDLELKGDHLLGP